VLYSIIQKILKKYSSIIEKYSILRTPASSMHNGSCDEFPAESPASRGQAAAITIFLPQFFTCFSSMMHHVTVLARLPVCGRMPRRRGSKGEGIIRERRRYGACSALKCMLNAPAAPLLSCPHDGTICVLPPIAADARRGGGGAANLFFYGP
jgi:hypothetical protein